MLILFIDDDQEDYEMFCDAMKEIKPEARCIHLQDGAAGLRYLQHSANLPDYIFLDIHMPVMDGLECLTKIKANEKLKSIPVIMYTSGNDSLRPDATVKRYKEFGAAHVISKGSIFHEIVTSVKVFFSK